MTWLKCFKVEDGEDDRTAVWVNVDHIIELEPHSEEWSRVRIVVGTLPVIRYARGTTVAIIAGLTPKLPPRRKSPPRRSRRH